MANSPIFQSKFVCVCVCEKEGSLCPKSQAYKTSAECLQFVNTSLMSLSGESKWSALISSQIPLTSANMCVCAWHFHGWQVVSPTPMDVKEREKVWTTHSRSESTNPFPVFLSMCLSCQWSQSTIYNGKQTHKWQIILKSQWNRSVTDRKAHQLLNRFWEEDVALKNECSQF